MHTTFRIAAAAILSAGLVAHVHADQGAALPGFGVDPELNPIIPHLGSLKPHAMTEMPVKGMVAVESEGDLLFISQNGRYVIQGRAHDLWYDMALDGMESIDKSATTLNFAEMGLDTRKLNALVVGDPDAERTDVHTVFIDPYDEHSLEYLRGVVDLSHDYGAVAFQIVPAFGGESNAAAEHFACLEEEVTQDDALDALLAKDIEALPRIDASDCDMTTYRTTLLLAEQARIDGVPFTATASGEVIRGIPDDISSALRADKD